MKMNVDPKWSCWSSTKTLDWAKYGGLGTKTPGCRSKHNAGHAAPWFCHQPPTPTTTLPSLPPKPPHPVSSLPQEKDKTATNNSLCLVSAVVFLPVLLWPPVSSELVPLSSWQVLGKGKLFSRYRKWKWLKLSVMAHPHLEEGRGLEGEWGREIRVIWAIFHCRLLRPRLTSGWMIALNSWYGLSICVLSVLQRGCCIP